MSQSGRASLSWPLTRVRFCSFSMSLVYDKLDVNRCWGSTHFDRCRASWKEQHSLRTKEQLVVCFQEVLKPFLPILRQDSRLSRPQSSKESGPWHSASCHSHTNRVALRHMRVVLVVGSQLKASTKGEAVNNAMDGSQVQPVVPIWIRYPINTQQGNLYPQQRRTTRPKCFHHVARRSTIGQVTGKRMSYGFGPRKHREANTSPNRTCQPHFPRCPKNLGHEMLPRSNHRTCPASCAVSSRL